MKQFKKLEIWFDGNLVSSAEEPEADALLRRWMKLPALAIFYFEDGSSEKIELENL